MPKIHCDMLLQRLSYGEWKKNIFFKRCEDIAIFRSQHVACTKVMAKIKGKIERKTEKRGAIWRIFCCSLIQKYHMKINFYKNTHSESMDYFKNTHRLFPSQSSENKQTQSITFMSYSVRITKKGQLKSNFHWTFISLRWHASICCRVTGWKSGRDKRRNKQINMWWKGSGGCSLIENGFFWHYV